MKSEIFAAVIIIIGIAYAIILIQPTGMVILEGDHVIRIGYKPNANYVALFVALENGYFEEEGLEVETIRFDSTNTMMNAFAMGQVDATATGNVIVSYSLENRQSGLFKSYSFAFYTEERHPENLIVKKGSEIKNYQDIEGKRIGTNKGIFTRTMLRKFLETQGIVDFEIIELSSELQLQALEIGQIDALLSLEPYPTIAVEKGIGEYLEGGSVYVKTVGFTPSFSGGVISTAFLKEHPIEAGKFLRAMEKSIEFVSGNLIESKQILPKYIAIEQNIAEKITFPEFHFISDLNDEQKVLIQRTADFLSEEGIIKEVDTGSLLLENEYFE